MKLGLSLINWLVLSRLAIATSAAQVLISTQITKAATPRSSFVIQALYRFDHPLANQLSGEVATKMAVSPFAFYCGLAAIPVA